MQPGLKLCREEASIVAGASSAVPCLFVEQTAVNDPAQRPRKCWTSTTLGLKNTCGLFEAPNDSALPVLQDEVLDASIKKASLPYQWRNGEGKVVGCSFELSRMLLHGTTV